MAKLAAITMTAVTAAFCIGSSAIAGTGPVNQPFHNSDQRNVLAEPVPYPYGRARIVTRANPWSPAFVVSGPILTRSPAWEPRGQRWEPGSATYGAPGLWAHAHARLGTMAIGFNPFIVRGDNEPAEIRIAREIWLIEHGFVNRARIVVRGGDGMCGGSPPCSMMDGCMMGAAGAADAASVVTRTALPQPRATIRIERPENRPKLRTDKRLEARMDSPGHIVITNVPDEATSASSSTTVVGEDS